MRIVCVYTKQHPQSVRVAQRCVNSGKKFGYDVEMHAAIFWQEMDKVHEKYNLVKRYKPHLSPRVPKKLIPKEWADIESHNTDVKCPASRMANGTTHYLLYRWAVENNKSICILEHDAVFVDKLPEPIQDGIIQVSSHKNGQATKEDWYECTRAVKMRKYQPDAEFVYDDTPGVHKHPLTGTSGTSGYIVHPGAAKKMVDYIEASGIAFADRVREEHVGEGNIYLQVPQSIICDHSVRSTFLY